MRPNKNMHLLSVLSCSGFGLLLGVILGSFWAHFGLISGVILGVILGLFRSHLGVIFDRKRQYYVRKTSISTNHPFSCNHRFGTKKSPNNVILEVILPVIWDICLIENIIFT